MKTAFTSLLILLLISCHKPLITQAIPTNPFATAPLTDIQAIPLGNLNNDKIPDTAFVVGPKFLGQEEAYGDCNNGKCSINVGFSGGQPALHFENAVGAQI